MLAERPQEIRSPRYRGLLVHEDAVHVNEPSERRRPARAPQLRRSSGRGAHGYGCSPMPQGTHQRERPIPEINSRTLSSDPPRSRPSLQGRSRAARRFRWPQEVRDGGAARVDLERGQADRPASPVCFDQGGGCGRIDEGDVVHIQPDRGRQHLQAGEKAGQAGTGLQIQLPRQMDIARGGSERQTDGIRLARLSGQQAGHRQSSERRAMGKRSRTRAGWLVPVISQLSAVKPGWEKRCRLPVKGGSRDGPGSEGCAGSI